MTQVELHQRGMTDADLERRYFAACGVQLALDRQNPDSSQACWGRSRAYEQTITAETAVLPQEPSTMKPLGSFAVDDPKTHASFRNK